MGSFAKREPGLTSREGSNPSRSVMTTFAVIGSRGYPYRGTLDRTLDLYVGPDDTIVSGGAKGPDTWADEYAVKHELDFIRVPAKWSKYGKRKAGHQRNGEPILVVFSDDRPEWMNAAWLGT